MANAHKIDYPPEATLGDQRLRLTSGKFRFEPSGPSPSTVELRREIEQLAKEELRECGHVNRKEIMMIDEIRTGKHFDQLRTRREQLVMTLQHIGREQEQVEQNTDWLDQAAYQSRVNLLDRLNEWYIEEMHRIDKALLRITRNQYGLCLGCHRSIGVERLESVPEAEFCSACQHFRAGLEER